MCFVFLSNTSAGGQAAATMALCEFVAVLPQSPNAKILSASLHNQLRQTVCIYLFTHFVHVRTDVSAAAQVRGKSAGVSSLFPPAGSGAQTQVYLGSPHLYLPLSRLRLVPLLYRVTKLPG